MKLLYWKQSSVANPAVRVGGGYQVWTQPPNFLGFTIYFHSKNVRKTIPPTPAQEKKFGRCQNKKNATTPPGKITWIIPCSN